MSEWQPIETAPKDESVFLALNKDTEIFAAKFLNSHGKIAYRTCQQSFPERHIKMRLADGEYGWVRDEEFAQENQCFMANWCLWQKMYEFAPTHWMPLPKPPVPSLPAPQSRQSVLR